MTNGSQKRNLAIKFFLALAAFLMCSAAFAGGDWQIEELSQGGVGKYSSMKIDKDGNVHVVFMEDDGDHNAIKYGFWDHNLNRWFVMNVASGGSFCSLALDSQQRPHIAFVDAGSMSGAKLRYAYWNGAEWKITPVPLNADIIAYYASISLDDKDQPSISFYEYTGPRGTDFRVRLRVVRFSGKYWEVQTVDGDNQSGKFNALAIDARGHSHLAYANVRGETAGMRYGYWDGSSWRLEVLEGLPSNQAYVGYSVCLTLDKSGNPNISYSQYSWPFEMKYAVRKEGRWQIEVVDQLAGVGYPDRNAIALDESGQPYISYFDAGLGALRLAHRIQGAWVAETVDDRGVGFTSSLQIDRGVIWIGYADETGHGFKVARRPIKTLQSPQSAAIGQGK
jgi:hypothetical protein